MEEQKRFENHKEDEETFKKISRGKFDEDLKIDRKIWCIRTIRFMDIQELQLIDDMVLCSRYVSKILEEGRKPLEGLLFTSSLVSMINLQQSQSGNQHQTKVPTNSAWLGFFSNIISSNLVEFNGYLNNYLVYLQHSNLVVSRRNLRQFPIKIFVKSEYPKFPLESSESEEVDIYCKWALNELIGLKTRFTRVVKNLDNFMNHITEVCEEVARNHGSMENLQSKPEDLENFSNRLRTIRKILFNFLLFVGQKDEKAMEDGGNSGLKKPRIYYDFI